MTIAEIDSELMELYKSLLQKMKEGKVIVLNPEITKKYIAIFEQSIAKGYSIKLGDLDIDTTDFNRIKSMQISQIEFAAAKQKRMLEDMESAITAFEDKASLDAWFEAYHFVQNRVWLEAEAQMIEANAQMAERWHNMQLLDTLPNLLYSTVGDANVRPEHQVLDGINLPMDDPFWDEYYPPNGYRCRCDVQQNDNDVTEAGKLPNLKENEAVPPIFKFNAGKTNQVVSPKHPYFDSISKKELEEHCRKASKFYDEYK
jgi:SPP1 gp7 family putative phage head morphogenesis protein